MNPFSPVLRALTSLTVGCAIALTSTAVAADAPAPDTEAGFRPIFDGATLRGWDGDPVYWRIENGAIVGEITPATIVKQNTFLIWRGGTPSDFELKLDYRISARGNSGINYRSVEVAGTPFALRGYQADLDGQDRNKAPLRHTGQNYEERGRTFLARRGEIARVDSSGRPLVVGALGTSAELAALIRNDDWNEVHIIARGDVLTHLINGRVMSVVVDDDAEHRRRDGLIGVQVHVGPPMKVEFRRIRLKAL